MSETMTASENMLKLIEQQESAEGLIDILIGRALGEGRCRHNIYRAMQPDRGILPVKTALLAYVARLEACVDAARAITDLERHPRLAASLAALDRPEDGE